MDTVERWNGPVLLLGGALLVVVSIIHPQGGTTQFVQQPLWVPAHILESIAWMTLLLGVVGWYSRFSASLGRLGTSGFLLFFFAAAAAGGSTLQSDVLLRPYMAANSPSLDTAASMTNGAVAVFLIVGFTFIIGYFVFSVAVVRARVLPKWGLWLVFLQLVGVGSLFGLAISFVAVLVFEALLGLSIMGWGYAILSTRSQVVSSERLQVR